ncbi:hypothetical protein LC607_34070 [Nostoc sp. CHAB 5824]|nr:hypothetical protein [Nostoc sp. CHAB 5824]
MYPKLCKQISELGNFDLGAIAVRVADTPEDVGVPLWESCVETASLKRR